MHLADTLSRTCVCEVNNCGEVSELEEIDRTLSLAWSPKEVQWPQDASAQDESFKELRRIIRQGWPCSRAGLPNAAVKIAKQTHYYN